MAQASRKIIHVDCDCFYAAVEIRDDPSLRNRPVAVGGDPNRRGVIATCNYPARHFGVHSAMASSHALRLCPELVIVPANFDKYRKVSAQIHDIFRRYTSLIEPLSLDEAFLDVTDSEQFDNSATRIAEALRQDVRRELGITVSAGVAPNKFLAKVASDWRKPDGLFVITPEEVQAFVKALPVEKLFGVGQVTAGKLHALGVETCGDMQALGADVLIEKFGKQGYRLFEMAHGRDERPVVVSRVAKSVSVERTFSQDLPGKEACESVMPALVADLNLRLARKGRDKPIHKLFVKIRYSDFSTHTLERVRDTVAEPAPEDYQPLLDELVSNRDRPVRLMGVGVRFRNDEAPVTQLRLFD